MMQYPRTIRNFNAFIDGRSYAGLCLEGKLPELKLQLANHRGAGMDGTVAQDMGMEAMKAEITLAEWPSEVITLIGTRKRMTFRPVAKGQEDHTADGFVCTLGGLWASTNFGDLKPGSDSPLKLTLEVDYFRMLKDGEELFEIDIQAGKRVVGGVDQLKELRAKMGF
ncbi:phage major tail tube protein [Aliiroseovarius crassostreae]|uniref:phage major tail tube protein n=1 Tax=Aliiroseovarius crassostreae TaxID=154981 RepID=UPI0021B0631F|nr:phage major tail tube protein [Aliiroseovarius crassostreae]UWQ00860.1 phage major tail tube protein [Aliiroseovarius crassostreae]